MMRSALMFIGAFALACGAPPATTAATSPATTPASTTAAPTTTAPTIAATTAPPRTSPPRASVQPGFSEVTLEWEAGTNVGDIDDVTDIITHLKEKPGIAGGHGDELFIVVAYDPQRITVAEIRRLLAEMGYPTKAPRA